MPGLKKHITVLLPTYNDAGYIENAIKSILNQTYKDFEFLIIDDGSNDNTEEVIMKFKDSRIIYKKKIHNGLSSTLNFGLKISYGDWIARIDSDDVNTPHRLQQQVAFINTNPPHNVISSWSVYFKNPARILFSLKPPSDNTAINKFLNLHNPINHSSVIFNKKKIMEEGGYNESFKIFEDFELWFRMKEKLMFKILPEILVFTRIRTNSLTQKAGYSMIYEMLNKNASNKLKSTGCEDKIFWNNILFWIEYFYGDKKKVRKFFLNDLSVKKAVAVMNSFLPDNIFKEIIELRLRHRFKTKLLEKKSYEKELNKLLM